MRRRKLFVSFTGLVYGLAGDEFGPNDLTDALFYFGCCRELLFAGNKPRAPGSVIRLNFMTVRADDRARRRRLGHAIRTVQQNVAVAERDGRIAWRPNRDTPNTYSQLNDLLKRNGFRRISLQSPKGWDECYCCPSVQDRAVAAHLPLEVVY